MNPRVSIIILNWNGWKDTIECLESLYLINYPNYDVILVDNNSQDDYIEKIRQYCKGEIPVESKFFKYNPENKPIKIIEYVREEAEFWGGKENEIKDLPSNRKLILIKNEKNYGFAEGNNIAMRYALKTLNQNYNEDAELSWRAYRNGWKAKYVPSSIIYHKRGKTIRRDKNILYKIEILFIKNMTKTVKVYGTSLQKLLFVLFMIKNILFGFISLMKSIVFSIVGIWNKDKIRIRIIRIKLYINSIWNLYK